MSPEQVFGEKDVDVRADIWSLGVILYECLCGHRPFEGENFGQLLKAVTIGRFEPIENVAPWVGAHLSSLISRMLRDRSQRLTDLAEVEHALSAIRGTPSGPMLPMSLPRISQVGAAATVLPQTGSGGYPVVQSSGGFPAAAPMSGGYPMAQSSGGYPVAQPPSGGFAMTPAGGGPAVANASGGYPTAPSPAMTPSPMVRSQTLEMSPRPDAVPMQSPPFGKIALVVGAVLVLGVGATLVVRSVRHVDPAAAASPSTSATTPVETVTAPVTSTVTSSTPTTSLGVPIADAGVAVAPHGTAPHGGASASGASLNGAPPPPSASNANANHTGPTGGLSTAVPF